MPVCPIVLVAEDNPSDQFLLRRAIDRAGLNIHPEFVADGLEAVHYLEHYEAGSTPNLLLLDLKMPRMDGFQLLEWLQQHPALRPGHVVILSSCYEESDLKRASRLGVEHYVVKPADPVEFAATVKRLESYCTDRPGTTVEKTQAPLAELLPAA